MPVPRVLMAKNSKIEMGRCCGFMSFAQARTPQPRASSRIAQPLPRYQYSYRLSARMRLKLECTTFEPCDMAIRRLTVLKSVNFICCATEDFS